MCKLFGGVTEIEKGVSDRGSLFKMFNEPLSFFLTSIEVNDKSNFIRERIKMRT